MITDRVLRILEYDRIRAMLAEQATSLRGKELAAGLLPGDDRRAIAARLEETSEARGVLRSPSPVPLGGLHDLRGLAMRAAAGATLDPRELLDIAATIAAGRNLRRYLTERRLDFPRLGEIAAEIGAFPEIETSVNRAIDEHGEINDAASPELSTIRRQQRIVAGRIKDKMDNYIRNPETLKLLQDPIVTIRDDRYVVPVKQEYRGQFHGIVHDQSASGATLFIEPLAVVEMNNELKQLELRERDEIRRILRELSDMVGRQADELRLTSEALADIDLIFARGKLSRQMNAVEPELDPGDRLLIKQGRHPLLTGKVVPIDVRLGLDFDTLVITGPNTGGKTVTLKTVGLLTLMMMSGLHVPADTGTRLALFDGLFVDIGDEQSISQNLSTFSSHMTNIVHVMSNVDEHALVLLDEVGAGTDPAEGAALAMSILEHLHGTGAKTIATTHYSELKTFAYTRERIENASVEFDVETLRPTYRLMIGLPGSSNAFEISLRLGLDWSIIDRARSFLSRDDLRVDELIRQIEQKRTSLDAELRQAEEDRRKVRGAKEEYDARMRDLAARERQTLEKAQHQAIDVLTRARREAEDVIKQIRAAADSAEVRDREQAIQRARAQLREARGGIISDVGEPAESWLPTLAEVKLGQLVEIRSLRQTGHVLAVAGNDGQVLVQAGIMKIRVPLSDLRAAAGEETVKAPAKRTGPSPSPTVEAVSPEVDLRGLTVDDALFKLDKYLDDAWLAGATNVRIIHGKGTGAVRQAVRAELKGHPHVKSQRRGEGNEGGDGVTVAELHGR